MKHLIFLFPLLLAGCASKPEIRRDAMGNVLPEPFEIVDGEPTPTDTARFLAGRPVRNGAMVSTMQQSVRYRKYSKDTLLKWKYKTAPRIESQDQWQSEHIRPLTGRARTVLYPFGGPDLLYVMSLFPDSSRYILLGLEPVGGMPDLEHSDPSAVIDSLSRHERAIETQLLHGYFITKDMKTNFSNGPLQGVTPVLLSALGLLEAKISNVQAINAGGNPGVEIHFSLPGRGRKSMVYVSGDLSNGKFRGAYESWLASQASGSTAYFKAASYLMQNPGFSGIRDWVLSNCRSIVQDDSGIPYRAFDQTQWQIHLFGRYTAPIDFFSRHRQSDLAAAYQAAGPRPGLSFGSGYQMKESAANLMVAERK
jgi:hypothetical protein